MVLGAPPAVAEAVQGYAGAGSVLIGSQFVSEIPRLAAANRPLLDSRLVTLTDVPSQGGVPNYAKATLHWSRRPAVPSGGVKAVAAVLRASKTRCRCAVLYAGPAGGAYDVALVASSPPYAAAHYAVTASTLSVHRKAP